MDVILYSNGCPRCKVLKQKLDAKSISYIEEGSLEKMIAIGIKQVPMLDVGGNLLDFGKANDWVNNQ